MKTLHLIVGMFSLGTVAVQADTFQLVDGTILDGELGAPTEVAVRTSSGEKRIPFSQLPLEIQQRYWRSTAEEAARAAAATTTNSVTADDLIALSNEVNLETWEQVASIGSFRDRAEKRGTGGLVVVKGFNALEENWSSVYSPKDPVGLAGNWDGQVVKARSLFGQTNVFIHRRWLANFIKAGEAVARRDSNEFAVMVRELRRNPLTTASVDNSRNFFTAK